MIQKDTYTIYAEIFSDGAPADLEAVSETDVVYLAQIRDGIVRPYISEIGIVTDTDKWNAVYTACGGAHETDW